MGCHRNKEKEGSPLFFYCHDKPPALSHYFRCSEKSFSSPFSLTSSLSRLREAPSHLSTIRCFPFLAVRHSPSYRQRKRSLDSARDDDTGNVLFPHILCMMHGIAIPHAVISSAARNLFRPLFPDFFAKPFMGNTVHLSAIRCFPFLITKCTPLYRQRKRSLDFARDDDTGSADRFTDQKEP